MTDEKKTEGTPKPEPEPAAPPAAEPAPAPAPAEPGLPKDVQEGKTFAILSYALTLIGLPFFLVPLIMRNNTFALYHAKQCLMIWLGAIAISIVGSILSVVCIGIIILLAGWIFLVVLDIMGLINAVKGLQKPLPLIGKWAEDWFKGLVVVQS